MNMIEYLKESQKWLTEAQHGDPNGAKAYQASKYIGYAMSEIEAMQKRIQHIEDEYIGIIEMCDGCIHESEQTEKVERGRGLNPIDRKHYRDAYEHIKDIYTRKLEDLRRIKETQ